MKPLCGAILICALSFPFCGGQGLLAAASDREAEIVVYGGTSAGVIAAIQAARLNKEVLLVCPESHLGGMTSGGLGFTDSGHTHVVGGLAREFYHQVWRKYQSNVNWRWQERQEFENKGQGTKAIDDATRTMWTFEPHIAETVFDEMLAQHHVEVLRNEWLDRDGGVEVSDSRITSLKMLSGLVVRGAAFVDATYEGDLMAASGVPYQVGRESNSVFGEKWNGVQISVLHHRHNFGVPGLSVDPYRIRGDSTSGLLPHISNDSAGGFGSSDKRIQAYCFRMCLSDHPSNRVPFPRPAFYNPNEFELLARIFEAGWNEAFSKFDGIPNRKTDTNNHGPFSTDNIGMNYDYPEASYERRAEILEEHKRYQQGLMFFLANDERVPETVREQMNRWGLAKDEFVDNGHWPHQIYVREARRMVGTFVMTEHEVLGKRSVPNAIGMGSYTMDSHNVQRYVKADGTVENEGDIGVKPDRPYSIAYGAIIPQKRFVQNLLVPVALSSSHIAYGSIRMEPVFMILGQSAATAASLSIEKGIPVQDILYGELKSQLLKDGQILSID
ncbi:MAG: FAD-dependent oxidoreductase [Verrucomicrobia bacterium]|jgi:hypothetical protein|nr:FAD-dependent oxidoreductase [Verrucomicrobiota bacterium]